MRDYVACIDAESGKIIWDVNLAERYNVPLQPFGQSSSPLVAGDALYIQAARSLLKLDKKTGKEIWRSIVEPEPKFEEGGATNSPILTTIHGRPMIIAVSGEVHGIDPETGKVLFSGAKDETTSPLIMTPTMYGEKIFLSSGGLRSGLWEVKKSGEAYTLERLWENKTVIYMSSPIIVGDYAYLHLKNLRLACIDLKTGKETWITGERFGYYCSFVANGDRILAMSENGTLFMFRANPEKFEIVDQKQVADTEAWAYVAAAGEDVYVRSLTRLAAFQWCK